MTRGLDEVQARMDAVVSHLLPVDPVLLLEIRIEASLDVLDNGLPALVVVDIVTEPGGVDDRESQADAILLNV